MEDRRLPDMKQKLDIAIVGAGISGINAAYRIQSAFPDYSYAVLESRDSIGGTWDLFKYPGIRSDSDLFTFGFQWHPWNQQNPIAEGPAIKKYLHDAVAQHSIDKHILLKHHLKAASWSSVDQRWTLQIDNNGSSKIYSARFVIFGTGYYDYREPLRVQIPDLQTFKGPVIHPQFWPEDMDYTDKRVTVIGSGATAVTLMPKLAERAAHTTMLQRSPTYIMSVPNAKSGSLLSRLIPSRVASKLIRINWIITPRLFFLFCRRFPNAARWIIRKETISQLPSHIPFDPHFNPRYNPWDQRVCLCPDGDFFKALHTGRVEVKTGTIKAITETGIQLDSGDFIGTDIIVTATGLKLQAAGGVAIDIDGQPFDLANKFLWNGVMLQDLPNAAYVIGYTNASWTLGADATAHFVVRLLKRLDKKGYTAAVPRMGNGEKLKETQLLNLKSTYIAAAERSLPKVAETAPWQPRDNYVSDYRFAKYGRFDDETLELIREPRRKIVA